MSCHLDRIGDSILYELLVYSEWIQEPEILLHLTKPQNKLLRLATRPWTIKYIIPYGRGETVNDKIARLVSARLPWQFASGEDGKVVAIIQDTLLEIRTARDEFSSVVGRATIARDHFPQYRQAVWSPDCSLLACAFSSGRIGLYDLLGSNILNIEPKNQVQEEWPSTDEAIAGILFLEDRVKSPKWSYELIAVDFRGNLRSFLVSPTEGFREHHTFSFSSYYRNGITAVHLVQPGNLLILAGPTDIQLEQKGRGSSAGLSAWRILSDHPFYSPALSSEEDLISIQGSRGIWAWMPSFRSSKQSDVLSMRVSPGARLLACLHASGAVSLWQLPSLRLFKHWHLAEQPDHNSRNPQLVAGFGEKIQPPEALIEFLPVDISWWSEQALILARYSGSVSVCSTSDLHNMLGESPEFFAGQPQVSAASGDGRGFLSLECEVNVTSKRPRLDDSTDEQADDTSSDEAEPSDSLFGRGTSAVKAALYWVTDNERFRPHRPKPRILKRTYRLLGLKSTTPEELYARKIDNEEYGEALQLARAYGLDCDLVYQRQWRSQKVSVASIHDYLSKINKRSWVLRECCERVPETAKAARELLKFGLQTTSLQVLLSTLPGKLCMSMETSGSEEESEDQIDSAEVLSKLKLDDMNSEQLEILQCRQKLLIYLDMLSTYELILGENNSEELYEASFYDKFRSQSPLQSVVQFARDCQWQAVSCMLTYHSKSLLRHRLPILSSFPETMDPFLYRSLLPECEDDQVVPWPIDELREQDWSEELNPRSCDTEKETAFLYSDDESLLKFCCEELTKEQLCAWYIARATQLEASSKMVDHALSLITLGQERSVQGLDSLLAELLTLETLVYEVQVEDLTLALLRLRTPIEQAHLLMSKSTADTFMEDSQRWLLPHLKRCEKENPGCRKELLRSFLIDLSNSSLLLPLQVFKNFKSEQPGPLFASVEEAISVALDCLYTYPEADQLDLAFQFLECLPEKEFGEKNKNMMQLHSHVDQLEGQLAAAEILGRHADLGISLSKLHAMGGDEKAALRSLVHMARSMTKRVPPPSQAQWSTLLTDMLNLQAKVFSCIELEKCFEIYAETLLASGNRANIRYAGTIMECSKMDGLEGEQKIRYEVSIRLVLGASREYFDSAGSLQDPGMELAKSCLLLITDENNDIKEELDLISSLQLLSDFGVSMLPIQVRLCSDKLRLLRDCLRFKPSAYRSTQRLLQLANYLRVSGDDNRAREAAVLVLIAGAAIKAGDYTFCAETCQKMMDRSHSAGWQVAQELAECDDFHDVEVRHRLLAFAILHCEAAAIEQLVTYRCKLEAQLLHGKISSQVADGATKSLLSTSPSLDEFSDALSSPEVERKDFSVLPQVLPQILQQSAEVLRDTTRSVLLNISNETFWRSAFNWLPQTNEESTSVVDSVMTQGFHSFYMGLHGPHCHESMLGLHYDSYATPNINDPTLELLLALVRVSLLEETEISDTEDVALTDEVILKAGRSLLLEDCHIGLSLLLALNDVSHAKEFFLQLPRSIVTLQLAAYYFAIRVCMEELPKEDLDSRRAVFLCDPQKLIHQVYHGTITNAAVSDTSKEARKLLASFLSLQSEFLQTLQLQSLDCGVDPLRFSHDEQYRHDSIIGLAMTQDPEQYELAESLAERYNVPTSHLALAHISHLLLSEPPVTQETLLTAVQEHSENLDSQVFDKMEQQILPNISGTDHQRLICFYYVLQSISDTHLSHGLPPSQHIKLIKKVKATSPGIDYKVLVCEPSEVLFMLKPILSQDNITMVAKLLKSLPATLKCNIQPGILYKTWMHKLFFEVSQKASEEQWLAKFELSKDHFPKLTPTDIVDLASELAFSEDAYAYVPRKCRLLFLEDILKFCRGRQQMEEWGLAASQLQQWTSHLEMFTSESSAEVLATPKCRDFARRLELSKSDENLTAKIREDVIKSEIPFLSVSFLFSLQPSNLPLLSKYLLEKLSEAKETKRPELVSAVLRRMSQMFLEHAKDTVDMKVLQEEVDPLCADTSLEPSVRLQALHLMQFASSEKGIEEVDGPNRALYTTQAVLASAWPGQAEVSVQQNNLKDSESRNELFDSLMDRSDSWDHLLGISEILHAWQTAGMECSGLWPKLTSKILLNWEEKETEIAYLLENLFKSKTLISEESLEIVQAVKNVSLQLRLCFLNDNESLHAYAVHLLQDQDPHSLSGVLDSELMQILVTNNVVAKLVPTPAYPLILAHLLETQEDHPELIPQILQQLVNSGHVAEAGTLHLHSQRLPAALTTFSTALQLLPKCQKQ